jgi:hypothetical protein
LPFFHRACRERNIPAKRDKKQQQLTERYQVQLAKLERQCVEAMLKVYRHRLLKPDVDPDRHHGLDLATAETWRKWGLSRWQLATAGALAGGAAGAAFDLGVGVHSLGAGTVIGAVGGGAAAFFKGGSLPELRVKIGGGFNLGMGDGTAMSVGPPASPNFPWVLLDCMLVRFDGILARAHGRRDEEILRQDSEDGFTRRFPSDRRALLQKWFTSCLKGSPDRGKEPEVFSALVEALDEVENAQSRN